MLQEKIAIQHNVLLLPGFFDADVAASQTDVQLPMDGSGNAGYVMKPGGFIIGLRATLSAAATAGSLTIGVTIDGTEVAGTTQTVTTGQEVAVDFPVSKGYRYTEGQQIGVEITTDGTWNGTTADLSVQVLTVSDPMDF